MSERIYRIIDILVFGSAHLADRLPKGVLRFVGNLIAAPIALVGAALSFPLMIIGMFFEMWEEANK